VGILQTIPSLAMLAILLALLNKIGAVPAIIALTLYALLPIVRNTLAGLQGVEPAVVEAARGIGMTPSQRLVLVEVPLAMPVILAGISPHLSAPGDWGSSSTGVWLFQTPT